MNEVSASSSAAEPIPPAFVELRDVRLVMAKTQTHCSRSGLSAPGSSSLHWAAERVCLTRN